MKLLVWQERPVMNEPGYGCAPMGLAVKPAGRRQCSRMIQHPALAGEMVF